MTTDQKSMLFVEVIDETSTSTKKNSNIIYANNIAGTFYTAQNGIFTIDSLVLTTTPNSTQILKFKTNEINFDNDFNKINSNINVVTMIVNVRSCIPGEEISSKGE